MLFRTADALSCLPCEQVGPCAPVSCQRGVEYDVCGCCQKCRKLEGEVCGGPWGVQGSCGGGLHCELDPSWGDDDFNADGLCVKDKDVAITFGR